MRGNASPKRSRDKVSGLYNSIRESVKKKIIIVIHWEDLVRSNFAPCIRRHRACEKCQNWWPWGHVTSSRRHFVSGYYWPYLPNGRSVLNQICYESTWGQGSNCGAVAVRARVMKCAYARVKIWKCSKWPSNYFAYVLGHFEHLTDFRACASARAVLRTQHVRTIEISFFHMVSIPNTMLNRLD